MRKIFIISLVLLLELSSLLPVVQPVSAAGTAYTEPIRINTNAWNANTYNELGPFIVSGMSLGSWSASSLSTLNTISSSNDNDVVSYRIGIGSISFLNQIDVAGVKRLGVVVSYNPEGGHTPAAEFDQRMTDSDSNPIVQFAQWGDQNGIETHWAPLRGDADRTSDSLVQRIYQAGMDGFGMQEQKFIETSCPTARYNAVKTTVDRHRRLAGKPISVSVQIMASRCSTNVSCSDMAGYSGTYGRCDAFIDLIDPLIDTMGIWPSSDDVSLVRVLREGTAPPGGGATTAPTPRTPGAGTPVTQPTSQPGAPTQNPLSTPGATRAPRISPTGSTGNNPSGTRPGDSARSRTRVRFRTRMHGIGRGGDSRNPRVSGNRFPRRTQRQVTMSLTDRNNRTVTRQGLLNYDSTTGDFLGEIDIEGIPSGSYAISVRSPQYLVGNISGVQHLQAGQLNDLPEITLITGDTNQDNSLSILDYNTMLDCFSDFTQPRNCSDITKKELADVTDNGIVDHFDYNLFLRELLAQMGQ